MRVGTATAGYTYTYKRESLTAVARSQQKDRIWIFSIKGRAGMWQQKRTVFARSA